MISGLTLPTRLTGFKENIVRQGDMRENDNMEDERASPDGGLGDDGIRLGIDGVVVAIVVGLLMSKNPLEILDMVMQTSQDALTQSVPHNPAQSTGKTDSDHSEQLASHVPGDTENTWTQLFK